jgi:hypothetical protein
MPPLAILKDWWHKDVFVWAKSSCAPKTISFTSYLISGIVYGAYGIVRVPDIQCKTYEGWYCGRELL